MQAIRSGRAIPPRLLQPPPEVHMGLGIFMQAYFQLAADRSQSGRIPWSTIQRWCDAKGITGDDAEDAHFLLVRMDMAYLEWAKKKGQKSGDTSGLRKKDA